MKKQKLLPLSSFFILLFSGTCFANPSSQGDWFKQTNWETFVSQSAIYSSDYNFLSQSDDTLSFDMREAGILFSTIVREKLTFSTQILGRKVSEDSGNDFRVDYAFLSYPFYQTQNNTLGVRLGRIRSSYGFYNETRDIPHTRTGIVMPQSIYFDMTRNSFYSADGIELYGFRDFANRRLAAQVYVSKPIADDNETGGAAFLNPSNFDGDKSLLAKISYGSEFDGFRAAFTYYRPEYNVDLLIPIGPVFVSDTGASVYSENMLTSLEYNQFDWSVTAEYLRHKFQVKSLGSKIVAYEEAFYVQGLFRLNEQWEAYLRYDSTEPHGDDVGEDAFNWDDINIGASYRPNNNWLIRAEIHYIEGQGRLLTRDNPNANLQDPYWTAAMFQVAYKW